MLIRELVCGLFNVRFVLKKRKQIYQSEILRSYGKRALSDAIGQTGNLAKNKPKIRIKANNVRTLKYYETKKPFS